MTTQNDYIEDKDLNLEDEVETQEDTQEEETQEEKTEREKQLEAEVAKYKRMAKQKAKKAEKATQEDTKSDQSGLGYAEKAYLKASGISGKDEFALVESVMKESGMSLDDVVDSGYFKHQLKELREDVKTKKATPSGSKRSKTSSRDQVDYWLAKGELPPADQPQLRREVVNARIKSEKTSNFSDSPVIQ